MEITGNMGLLQLQLVEIAFQLQHAQGKCMYNSSHRHDNCGTNRSKNLVNSKQADAGVLQGCMTRRCMS